jgi:hypothetical protein
LQSYFGRLLDVVIAMIPEYLEAGMKLELGESLGGASSELTTPATPVVALRQSFRKSRDKPRIRKRDNANRPGLEVQVAYQLQRKASKLWKSLGHGSEPLLPLLEAQCGSIESFDDVCANLSVVSLLEGHN